MAEVFISYSRHDQEFVRRLHAALQEHGKKTWIDWKEILPTAEWFQEIQAGIEAANAFVFVLTPDSVASDPCTKEITHALAHNKRLIPILHRDVAAGTVHEALAARNWIFFRGGDDFEKSVETLLQALDLDLEWIHAHTRLLTRAAEWEKSNQDPSLTLSGSDLQHAEHWLAQAGGDRDVRPTTLQTQFILTSRRIANRRYRRLVSAVLIGLSVILVLGLLTWQQRQTARLYEASDISERALLAMGENDVQAAEVYLAKSLTYDDRIETRERLVDARARVAPLLNTIYPEHPGSGVIALSSDGRRFAAANQDSQIQCWDVATGKNRADYPGNVTALAYDANGRRLAACDALGNVWEWDTRTGVKHTLSGKVRGILCLAYSRNGALLAGGSIDHRISLWDTETGRKLHSLLGSPDPDRVKCIAFSPDGAHLASGHWDHTVRLWDTVTGRQLRVLQKHEDAVTSVTFSPAGDLIATGGMDNRIWTWDAVTGRPLQPLTGHKGTVQCLAFSPDGKRLASGAEDHMIRLWDLDQGQARLTLHGHQSSVLAVAFGGRGRQQHLSSVAEDGTERSWDMAKVGSRGELTTLRGHTGPVSAVALDGGKRALASGGFDGALRLWHLDTGVSRTLPGHKKEILSIDVSGDGTLLASGGKDNRILLWDLKRQQSLPEMPCGDHIRTVAFSPDSRDLASGDDSGTVRIWNVKQNSAILTPPVLTEEFSPPNSRIHQDFRQAGMKVLCVAFSPDGRLLAISSDTGVVLVWDLIKHRVATEMTRHAGAVWGVVFSPDGSRLASGGDDGAIMVSEVASGKVLQSRSDHAGGVNGLDFSADGRWIASAGQDATVELWNTETNTALKLRCYEGPVWCVGFHHSNTWLASGGLDRVIRVWNVPRLLDLMTARPGDLLVEAEHETGLRLRGTLIEPVPPRHSFLPK